MSIHRKKIGKGTLHRDVRPPHSPWISFEPGGGKRAAALSFYYSDPRSKIPIREVSHKNNPKGDPNIETRTFGLFSRCDERMRATMVKEGINLHFFCTSRAKHVRVLTGYYRYGWHYKVPSTRDDYMLAAQKAKFVTPGFPLKDLIPYLRRASLRFRTFRYLDKVTADLLLLLIEAAPGATSKYKSEIRRLEKLSLSRDGYLYGRIYPNGFSWNIAPSVMKLKP
jgi:hypothetical protein